MCLGFLNKVDEVDDERKNKRNKLKSYQLKHHWAWSQVNTLLIGGNQIVYQIRHLYVNG
jgi:hypothetical protein